MARSQRRKQRRTLAKQLGYTKKNESFKERMERIRRAQIAGDELHTKHLEGIKNAQLEAEEVRKEKKVKELVRKRREDEEKTEHFPDMSAFNFLKSVDTEGPQASGTVSPQENSTE
jgi:hypothetical protein